MKFFRSIFVLTFAITAIFFVPNFLICGNIALASEKININTANATELDAIPEVGPSTAGKIITYRTTVGPFLVIEDIMKVSGIKEATFAKMKDFITVGNDVVSPVDITNSANATSTDDGSENNSTDNNTASSNLNSSSNNDSSAHYEQSNLSNFKEPTTVFKVSAGRERVTFVGSPVKFEAKAKNSTSEDDSISYIWTFGDGASARGEIVTHYYKYAGQYNVVLNAENGEEKSVARTVVKVLEPNLALAEKTDGSVEISNKNNQEMNLYGWALVNNEQKYVFPLDTIISGGQKNIFPKEYTKFSARNNPWLVDSTGKGIIFINSSGGNYNPISMLNIKEVEAFIMEYKKLLGQNIY